MATVREEDYLEAIYHIVERKGYARVGDIARELDCSSATVTEMFRRLSNKGFVNYEKYGGVTLTMEGKRLGSEVVRRHEILRRFLITLGVEDGNADEDACRMEHNLHAETIVKLDQFLRFVSLCPPDSCWLDKYRMFRETGKLDLDDCPRDSD